MNPGTHPTYAVVPTADGQYQLIVDYHDGTQPDLTLTLATSKFQGFLEQTKADLENSVIDFEELSEQWGIDPKDRQIILDSLTTTC